jgi:hypothetical protein
MTPHNVAPTGRFILLTWRHSIKEWLPRPARKLLLNKLLRPCPDEYKEHAGAAMQAFFAG